MLGSIPSPPFNAFDIGPLTIHVYGIVIAIGVMVAFTVITKRYARFAGGAVDLDRVLFWAIVLGFLGARVAYVSTHTARFTGRWYATLFIWEGGLALFGGLTVGTITAILMLRRAGGDTWALLDAAAVGVPLAQAIGRWGNYFNQELFGTPSTLPWAVEIDPVHRPDAYLDAATFHPTFLYESLWNALVLVPVILWLERRGRLRRGQAAAVYLVMYGVIRFGMELLRTDTTFRLLGISRNGYVAIGALLLGVVVAMVRRTASPQDAAAPGPASQG